MIARNASFFATTRRRKTRLPIMRLSLRPILAAVALLLAPAAHAQAPESPTAVQAQER